MNRLRDNFKEGEPIVAVGADWFNTVARWLNSLNFMGGPRIATPFDLTLYAPVDFPAAIGAFLNNAAWYCVYFDMDITIKEGDIELGADTVIEWSDITNAATTVTATDGAATWYVWVNVDMAAVPPTAEMFNDETITALTSDQKKTIYQKRICKATITNDLTTPTNDVISGLVGYQCGNITIPQL